MIFESTFCSRSVSIGKNLRTRFRVPIWTEQIFRNHKRIRSITNSVCNYNRKQQRSRTFRNVSNPKYSFPTSPPSRRLVCREQFSVYKLQTLNSKTILHARMVFDLTKRIRKKLLRASIFTDSPAMTPPSLIPRSLIRWFTLVRFTRPEVETTTRIATVNRIQPTHGDTRRYRSFWP